MGRLNDLYDTHGQSPWLDNLKRGWITSGELQRWIDRGVRGQTSNPTIFAKAISEGSDYDEQFSGLVQQGQTVDQSYWHLVTTDMEDGLAIMRPVYDASDGLDGYVSVEVAPGLAHDTEGTDAAAKLLWDEIDEPNLYVKIPATAEGVEAIRRSIAAGRNINVTLLFSLSRYDAVAEAYISGLEELVARGDDPTHVASVASFFVSRVDTLVNRKLDEIGTPEAAALKSKAALANARLAYEHFLQHFSGPRWEALAAKGARVQRPLWASTSTKDPALPDTMYVDGLIAPDTVNTMPEATLKAFDDHGTLARTADADFAADHAVVDALLALGIDLEECAVTLEDEGVASFAKSFDELIDALSTKADELRK